MSLADDLNTCMAPLPAPTVEGVNEVIHFMDQLHSAAEASGGLDVALAGLIAAGAVVGIDEAAVGVVGEATVAVYLGVLAGCFASSLASDVWGLVASTDTPNFVQGALASAAQERGIEQPEQTA